MNYDLALELKKAGFPQEGDYWFVKDGYTQWRPSPNNRDIVCPTLEELIEACGKDFKVLEQTVVRWWACGCPSATTKRGDPDSRDFEGQTPTEAVARLWLALNKKPSL